MAINLGDIEKQNYSKYYTNVGGLNLSKNKVPSSISTTKKEEEKRTWFDKGAFDDGYQFGDILKTISGTVGNVGVNLAKGVVRAGESLGDLGAYGGAQLLDWVGADNYANQVRQTASESLTDKIFAPVDKVLDKNSLLGEKSQDVISSIGNMYAQGITSAKLLGAKGNVPLKIGSKTFNLPVTSLIQGASGGISEAYQKGAEDWQAWLNGAGSGLAEGVSESLFGTFGLGGSDLDDALVKSVTSKMKSSLAKNLAKWGIKSTGEGVEEVASYLMNYASGQALDFVKNKTGLKGVDIANEFNKEELWDNFIGGALASGIGGLPSTIQSIRGQTPKFDTTEGVNQFNLPTVQEITETTTKPSEITIQEAVEQDKQSSLQNLPNAKFQYVKTDNAKINKLNESMAKYFDNSQKTTDLSNTISKIIEDKDYSVVFDDTLTNKSGNLVNAQISTKNGKTEIKINPNTPRAVEFLMVHEITHAIETDSMKQLVMDYASKNAEFNQALENLEQTYGVNDVSNEVLADISGQLFGNQQFINNLSTQKPSLFKRIYNKIVELANKITGNSNEALFIRDLKQKWENAYRTSEQAKQGTTYSQENNLKDRQLEIILNTNPAGNETVTWIRNKNDIKTFEETLQDEDWQGYDEFNPDYTLEMANNAINSGKIVVYSSYPIEQGIFVTPSKMEAESYSGNGKVYSKEVNLTDVAWIDPTQGQYAKVNSNQYSQQPTTDNQGRELSPQQQEYFKDSKVRDENGKLLEVYHGTESNFTVFDKSKVDKTSAFGEGFYFTPDLSKSFNYGKNLKKVYLNITNPYIVQSEQSLKNIVEMKINGGIKEQLLLQGYDGVIAYEDINSEKISEYVVFNPNQIKSVDNLNPTTNEDIRYSSDNQTWQQYLENNYQATGTRTYTKDILPTAEQTNANLPTQQEVTPQINQKTLNPIEIAQLTKEDASTTPNLPTKSAEKGQGKSNFAKNVQEKTNMLTEESKKTILSDEEVNYYREVSNEESLNQAFDRLNKGGKNETLRWFAQATDKSTSVDIAEGWILLKQYQDEIAKTTDLSKKEELNRSMVQVAQKMREMGTKAGQTVQAFNIMNRLTPEGMVYYAQAELDEAYNQMVKNKTKEWIDKYKEDFVLTPEETQFIMDTMKEVSTMQDGYDKRVKLAEIQKVMTDKLPPERGAGMKSWMRISMLFNPKTQIRNVAGNAIIAPVNWFGDIVGSAVDAQIAKATGVRTKGASLKGYGKGVKEGLFQSYNDFKKGINTRNIQGNRFEIGQGKSFNDKTKIGKALNRVDNLLSFMLDAGDRAFYEGEFTRSINNQLVLNNTTEVTQDMIDIATNEALQRTWQDNNDYTKFVLNVRNNLNKINFKGYGLGDVLIPFAKTPANLTKALIDYSPAGMISVINKGVKLKRSLTNGQYTPQLQNDFVNQLGKATAGTMLYILGTALAKAGVTSGESDEDKDVANFLKNTLGINSYSIKLGDVSFTYDWMQPIAGALAITANVEQKSKDGADLYENILSSLDTAGSILLEQSFLESINTALNNNDGFVSGLQEAILDLPSRAIPTLSNQIANMVDSTTRTSFEYDKPLESMINSIKYKIPFLTKDLAPSVNTLGEDIQRYGGANNIFNVFLNPANVNVENINDSASEIYRLYQATGDKTIMPRVAPYYINQDGEKITLSSKQKAEYQTISGSIITENVENLLDNQVYNSMSDADKATIINKIVNYAYNKAREEVLDIPMASEYNKINMYVADGGNASEYYTNKEEIDYSYENPIKYSTIRQITTYSKYQTYKDSIEQVKENYNNTQQRKYAVINYVNNLNLSIPQKAMLIKMNYSSFKDYDNQIIEYINSQDLTIQEKTDILKEIGFTVENGRVY